jgi:hypothetical protein
MVAAGCVAVDVPCVGRTRSSLLARAAWVCLLLWTPSAAQRLHHAASGMRRASPFEYVQTLPSPVDLSYHLATSQINIRVLRVIAL